jgi:hypothetical protein
VIVKKIYLSIPLTTFQDWHWLSGYHSSFHNRIIKPWKLLHAETLRGIWLARNQKVFEEKYTSIQQEIVATIKSKALLSIQYYHHSLKFSQAKNRRQKLNRNINLWTAEVPLCIMNRKGILIYNSNTTECHLTLT